MSRTLPSPRHAPLLTGTPIHVELDTLKAEHPEMVGVVELCEHFLRDLTARATFAVQDVRLRLSDGHLRLAVVGPEEIVGLARTLAPRHPKFSVFAIVNVADTTPAGTLLSDEERGFLDYLIESAIASWMLET